MGFPDWNPPHVSTLNLQRFTPADPGTNADVVISVGNLEDYRLLVVKCRLSADANVANRELYLVAQNSFGFILYQCSVGILVTAGQSKILTFAAGIGASIASALASVGTAPIPEMYLEPLSQIRLTFTNKQVGDRLSEVFILVEQFQR